MRPNKMCCGFEFDMPNSADLEVTYTDGHKEVIPGVRYQMTPDEPNPVVYNAGVLSVETTDNKVWYMVGVRKFRFLGEGE